MDEGNFFLPTEGGRVNFLMFKNITCMMCLSGGEKIRRCNYIIAKPHIHFLKYTKRQFNVQ